MCRKVKSCPFCGGELVKSMWGTWEDVNENCILYGFEVHEKHLPLWNTRKPMEKIMDRFNVERKREKPLSVTALLWGRAINIVKEVGLW